MPGKVIPQLGYLEADLLLLIGFGLTKATEEAYWSYVGDIEAQQSYFTKIANDPELEINNKNGICSLTSGTAATDY